MQWTVLIKIHVRIPLPRIFFFKCECHALIIGNIFSGTAANILIRKDSPTKRSGEGLFVVMQTFLLRM